MGKNLNKALISVLSLGMIVSMCSITVNAVETDNVANWVTMYGDNGNNSITPDTVNDAERLINGDIIATGTFDGNKVTGIEQAKGKSDGAVMLYDKNGQIKWETLIGGSAADSFNAVTEANDGSYVAVGVSQSNDGNLANLNKGGKDGIIAKLDSNGTLIKVVTVGGSDADELKAIQPAGDGGFIVAGYSHSTDLDMNGLNKIETDRDAIIVKIDQDLNIEWINRAGGTGWKALQSQLPRPPLGNPVQQAGPAHGKKDENRLFHRCRRAGKAHSLPPHRRENSRVPQALQAL